MPPARSIRRSGRGAIGVTGRDPSGALVQAGCTEKTGRSPNTARSLNTDRAASGCHPDARANHPPDMRKGPPFWPPSCKRSLCFACQADLFGGLYGGCLCHPLCGALRARPRHLDLLFGSLLEDRFHPAPRCHMPCPSCRLIASAPTWATHMNVFRLSGRDRAKALTFGKFRHPLAGRNEAAVSSCSTGKSAKALQK